jgi:hypothetical protein
MLVVHFRNVCFIFRNLCFYTYSREAFPAPPGFQVAGSRRRRRRSYHALCRLVNRWQLRFGSYGAGHGRAAQMLLTLSFRLFGTLPQVYSRVTSFGISHTILNTDRISRFTI